MKGLTDKSDELEKKFEDCLRNYSKIHIIDYTDINKKLNLKIFGSFKNFL